MTTPSGHPLVFYTGDTRPVLIISLIYDDESGPIDVSDTTVTISIRSLSSIGTPVYNAPCAILDGPNGLINYQLGTSLTLPLGVQSAIWEAQVTVNYGGVDELSPAPFHFQLVRRIGPEA